MQNPASMSVVEFIQRNLIGRTLTSEPVEARVDEDRTEVTYLDQTFFSSLVRRALGFDFDLTVMTLGRRFGLDPEGNSRELAGTMDAVRVYRYEMIERASTGRLLGFARYVSSTNTRLDPLEGTCFRVQMRVQDGALIVSESQIGYGDFPTRGGGRKPQALDCRYRYSLDEQGSLSVEFDQETFDVDPESFERRPSHELFPTQVSREVLDREGAPTSG